MPYIKKEDRVDIDNALDKVPALKTPGELNYAMTQLFNQYLRQHGMSYTNINAIVGAVECAKIELYRRLAVPYEAAKIYDNGDAYDQNLIFAAAQGKSQHEVREL
jgi:hypothetical protein